jgi:hypothetical protein
MPPSKPLLQQWPIPAEVAAEGGPGVSMNQTGALVHRALGCFRELCMRRLALSPSLMAPHARRGLLVEAR